MGAGHAHALYVHEHSPVHRLAPDVKLVAAVAFVLAVAVTPRRALWAFAVDFAVVVTVVRLARLRLRFVLPRLAAVAPFIVFALLIPFIATGERTSVLGLQVSVEGMWAMWNVIAKATLGALVSIVLATTTEVPDIIRGLGRLRVPALITTIAAFMIRYLEVIAGELGRMRTAMTARGYDPRWISQARPIASAAGSLFVRSYERGERVYDAMLARGYTGVMPAFAEHHTHAREWAWASLFPLVAIVAAVVVVL
ncbi:MAG TPA: cobalt ECF transporter T component CbiQ [Acidimicrobiia bacterium]|nr:cobalt ECF transporter T component CbiQ [Acidimicrobiia bacterium]